MKNEIFILNEDNNSEGERERKKNIYINAETSSRIFNNQFEEPIVSLFDNYFCKTPTKEIMLKKFLFTDKFKKKVEAYRGCHDEALRKKIKQSLPCVTPSGVFSQRQEKHLISHTKLICIDIDSKDNQKIDLKISKQIIGEHCPSLYYAGLSFGGEGIFLIFRISNPEHHNHHFNALVSYLNQKFSLNVDAAVRNPVSLRGMSFDADPYYNPSPIPFEYITKTREDSEQVIRKVSESDMIYKKVDTAVKFIYANRIDITSRYENWFKIGCALSHEFREEGRNWFHMISRMYKDYHENECDIQYNKCLKYYEGPKVKIATFFYFCKLFNIKF